MVIILKHISNGICIKEAIVYSAIYLILTSNIFIRHFRKKDMLLFFMFAMCVILSLHMFEKHSPATTDGILFATLLLYIMNFVNRITQCIIPSQLLIHWIIPSLYRVWDSLSFLGRLAKLHILVNVRMYWVWKPIFKFSQCHYGNLGFSKFRPLKIKFLHIPVSKPSTIFDFGIKPYIFRDKESIKSIINDIGRLYNSCHFKFVNARQSNCFLLISRYVKHMLSLC
jgi:hypothetical protein